MRPTIWLKGNKEYQLELLSAGVQADTSGSKASFWGGTLTFACHTPIESNQDVRLALERWLDAEAPGGLIIDDTGLIRQLSGVEIAYGGKAFEDYWRESRGAGTLYALITVQYRAERRPITKAVRERGKGD